LKSPNASASDRKSWRSESRIFVRASSATAPDALQRAIDPKYEKLCSGDGRLGAGTIAHPPRCDRLVHSLRLHAKPGGARGDGMAGLVARIKELLDALVVPGAAPGAEQAADGVDLEHVLKR
jgi:hypothetical protein